MGPGEKTSLLAGVEVREDPAGDVHAPGVGRRRGGRVRAWLMLTCTAVAAVCLVVGVAHIADDGSISKAVTTQILKLNRLTRAAKEPFTFDDIFNYDYVARSFVPTWIGRSNVYVYRNEAGDLVEFDADSSATTVLVPNSVFVDEAVSRYYVAQNRQYVLLAYERVSVWRRSFVAKYKIYDRQAADGARLSDFPNHPTLRGQSLQFAGWSSSGAALSFVVGNNLYFQSNPTTQAVQITTNGKDPYIFNGIPDWVYEEDVTSDRTAHYWSPDSRYIAHFLFNDTKMPVFKMPWYGPSSDIYPSSVEFTYPKAGNSSSAMVPVIELYVTDTTNPTNNKVRIYAPAQLRDKEHYYNNIWWRDDTHIVIAWTNRVQNSTIISICDVTSGTCQNNLEQVVIGGWCSVPWPRNMFINNGNQYVTILPRSEGPNGAFRQVALVTAPLDAEGVITYLTSGEQDVTSILGYEPGKKLIYYISTNGDQKQRHIFRVGAPDAAEPDRAAVCLTCGVSQECNYNSASFSGTGDYYVEMCYGPGVPQFRLKGTKDGRDVVLEDNAALKARLDNKEMPTRQWLQIPIGGGYQGSAELLLPPNFDSSKKYPLLIYAYAGPGSQMVTERFRLLGSYQTAWHTHLLSQQGVVIAMVDSRGAANRGDKFQFEMYRRYGTVEIEDQILAAKYLLDTNSWLDAKKSAIFGWSNGGYVTSHAVGNESDVYKCGLAVAPTTNYYYYDTAFSERFLALNSRDDNEAGYRGSDVVRKAANFRNKKYLIAHGSADDNVHYQHAAQMIKALVEENVEFSMQVYIDKNHGIYGGNTSRHLFRRLTNFLIQDCYTQNVVSAQGSATKYSPLPPLSFAEKEKLRRQQLYKDMHLEDNYYP